MLLVAVNFFKKGKVVKSGIVPNIELLLKFRWDKLLRVPISEEIVPIYLSMNSTYCVNILQNQPFNSNPPSDKDVISFTSLQNTPRPLDLQ